MIMRGLAGIRRLPGCAAFLPVLLFMAVMSGRAGAADELAYPVRQGDTLIGLGNSLLIHAQDWVKLQRINRIENPRRIPVGTILRIPFPLLKIERLTAEITAVSGNALVDGHPAEVGMQVGAGTSMTTDESGYIALKLPDGSLMTLPARSSARIETLQHYPALEGQDFDLSLERGRVESLTAPQRGPAARYRVDTPTAVIGVRGTDFRVGHDPETNVTRAETTRGAVGVDAQRSSPAGAGKRREHIVKEGFGVLAHTDGRLAPAALLGAPDLARVPGRFDRPVVRFALPEVRGAVAVRAQVIQGDGNGVNHKEVVLFDELFKYAGAPDREVRIAGLQDGAYRLRARAVAASGLEGHDAERAFTLEARPEPPFLTSPFTDGKVGEGAVMLHWTQSAGITRYVVELTGSTDFSAPLIYQDEREEPYARVDLSPGHYYWRVASVRPDGSSGPFSDVAHFEVRAVPEMAEVATSDKGTMQFSWSGAEGQRFDYQFAADAHFQDVLFEGSSDTPSAVLKRPSPDTYWMRVRAIDPDGFVGPWGTPQKVVIASSFPWWMFLPLIVVM